MPKNLSGATSQHHTPCTQRAKLKSLTIPNIVKDTLNDGKHNHDEAGKSHIYTNTIHRAP